MVEPVVVNGVVTSINIDGRFIPWQAGNREYDEFIQNVPLGFYERVQVLIDEEAARTLAASQKATRRVQAIAIVRDIADNTSALSANQKAMALAKALLFLANNSGLFEGEL